MKKVIVGALAAMFLAVTAPASAFAVVEQSVTPNQDEHRSTFVNDEHCDPAVDGHRHPFEQWVTDERMSGTATTAPVHSPTVRIGQSGTPLR